MLWPSLAACEIREDSMCSLACNLYIKPKITATVRQVFYKAVQDINNEFKSNHKCNYSSLLYMSRERLPRILACLRYTIYVFSVLAFLTRQMLLSFVTSLIRQLRYMTVKFSNFYRKDYPVFDKKEKWFITFERTSELLIQSSEGKVMAS